MKTSTMGKINAAFVFVNAVLFMINMALFAYQGRSMILLAGFFNLLAAVLCFYAWKATRR